MEVFLNPDAWIALLTLTFLEIVLGIDNIIFISIATGKLPVESRKKATKIGMFLAMFMRIALLFTMAESRNYGTKYHITSRRFIPYL